MVNSIHTKVNVHTMEKTLTTPLSEKHRHPGKNYYLDCRWHYVRTHLGTKSSQTTLSTMLLRVIPKDEFWLDKEAG